MIKKRKIIEEESKKREGISFKTTQIRCFITEHAAELWSYFCYMTLWLLWVYVGFKGSWRNVEENYEDASKMNKLINNTLCSSFYIFVWPIDTCWSDLALHIYTSSKPPLCVMYASCHSAVTPSAGGYVSVSAGYQFIIALVQGLDQYLETHVFSPGSWDDRKCSQLHSASWDPYKKESKDFVLIMNLYCNDVLYVPRGSLIGTAHISHTDEISLFRGARCQLDPRATKRAGSEGLQSIQRGEELKPAPSCQQMNTNPLGQSSSLTAVSFSTFTVPALTKQARRWQITTQAIKSPSAISLQDHPAYITSKCHHGHSNLFGLSTSGFCSQKKVLDFST